MVDDAYVLITVLYNDAGHVCIVIFQSHCFNTHGSTTKCFLHVVILRYQLDVKAYSRTLHICNITLYILTTSDHMYFLNN